MSADTVQVKGAVIQFKPNEEDFHQDKMRLLMQTDDGIQVDFDLDIAAAAILAITLQPALIAAKTRVDAAQGQ